MKPAAFAYHASVSLPEALSLLAELGDECKVLAGGQSLVPAMNFRLARPAALVDINGLNELDYVRVSSETIAIGALTRHAVFHRPVCDTMLGRLLTRIVRYIAHYPIRQRGTFGGSLCHADPASEWCLVTATLSAQMVLRSATSERVLAAEDFFKGTFTTVVEPGELLTEIRVPAMNEGWRFGFFEFSRRAGDFGLVMCLAALKVDDGRIVDARLGLGGVADRPLRLAEAEAALIGQPAVAQIFERVASDAAQALDPTEDIHASVEYRRDLVLAGVKRALAEAIA
ncbi:FAD binding domain-containing protein [Consotaella aegiceratis]|uniref:FAD binding domain-containing protein n=1 Tax=Consotaella aegiceratis TaxID=3097961 RepID=UPI002F42F93C